MKRLFLFLIIIILFSMGSFSQSKLGDVGCVYITTSNIDSSMAVYEKLGFSRTIYSDNPFRWALASDGSLLVMLRQDAKPFIGLTYYSADVKKVAAGLEKEISFSKKPKEGDVMQRYYITTPEGFTITLVNNAGSFIQPTGTTLLNMKQADFNNDTKYPNKQLGVFGEYALPVNDLSASIEFWKKLGFTLKANMHAPYPHAILTDGLMIIGLHQTDHFSYPAVTYFGMNTAKRIQLLKDSGLQNFTDVMGKNNVSFQTWEGQHFFIFSLGM
ncbi:MAG: hypothetical protein ABIW38_14200 [Ferruginibacter sp.]